MAMLFSSCYSQTSGKMKLNSLFIYHFKDTFINLENFKKYNLENDTIKSFKELSKYADRFKGPFWFDAYQTEVTLNNKKFVLSENKVTISDLSLSGKGETRMKKGGGSSGDFLLCTSEAVVHIQSLDKDPFYMITVYNEKGEVTHTFKLEHTKIINKKNVYNHYPYLKFFTYTKNNLVFTSYDEKYPLTYVLDIKTGDQKSYKYIINGIIRSEDENTVTGFVKMDEEKQKLKIITPDNSWTATVDNNYYDEAETILKDSILIVATYPKIATGSALAAYNFKTGKQVWKADVFQMKIDHSEYYNKVLLSLYGNKIIMEGVEAGGSYLQVFDILSGKRLDLIE